MAVQIRRGTERYPGHGEGIESRYAFSFGAHYDPANIHFGPLIAVNEERLAPGAGFAEHRHRDTEIVTWVLEGALEHRDSTGGGGVLRPGTAQLMSAGAGVAHTERNAGPVPVRFLQMWLRPDAPGGEPRYARREVPADEPHAVLASGLPGRPAGAAPLRRGDAALHLLRRPAAGAALGGLPRAPLLYAHVVRGTLEFVADADGDAGADAPGGRPARHVLRAGDAARVRDGGLREPRSGEGGVELLVWEMGGDLGYG
jgi:redox-sensitive bicupin YhaK (pirin superfamily)